MTSSTEKRKIVRVAVARHQDVHVEALKRLDDPDPGEDLDDRDGRVPLVAEHHRHEVGSHDDEARERRHGDAPRGSASTRAQAAAIRSGSSWMRQKAGDMTRWSGPPILLAGWRIVLYATA